MRVSEVPGVGRTVCATLSAEIDVWIVWLEKAKEATFCRVFIFGSLSYRGGHVRGNANEVVAEGFIGAR